MKYKIYRYSQYPVGCILQLSLFIYPVSLPGKSVRNWFAIVKDTGLSWTLENNYENLPMQ